MAFAEVAEVAKTTVETQRDVGDATFDPDRRVERSNSSDISSSHSFDPDRRVDRYYTDRDERMSRIASQMKDTVVWSGEPANSRATPDMSTPEGKKMFERLSEFGQTYVEYKDGIIDLSPFAKETVRIVGMTENRSETILPDGRFDIGNYIRADSALAARWNREEPKPDGRSWTAQDVNRWRKKNKLSPHECSDMETVQYVPKDIHSYFKHYGGVAECKARNAIERGVVENAM